MEYAGAAVRPRYDNQRTDAQPSNITATQIAGEHPRGHQKPGNAQHSQQKRRTGEARGKLVWRDRLVWIGGPGLEIDPQAPLPLILYAAPSLTRSVALETLERAGRAWRVVCTSGSLSGLRAAALAGLGITLHARSLIPEGLAETPATLRLPEAGEVEFVVTTRSGAARGPAAALAEAILANGDRLQAAS